MTPADPAVGAATMRPIDAFVSSTAIENATASESCASHADPPRATRAASLRASPPMSPPIDGSASSRGLCAERRITSSTPAK